MVSVGFITREIFVMPHNKEKTHTPSTGDGTMGAELGSAEQIWTIDGWFLTNLHCLCDTTATLMSRHALASRQSSTCSNTSTKGMIRHPLHSSRISSMMVESSMKSDNIGMHAMYLR